MRNEVGIISGVVPRPYWTAVRIHIMARTNQLSKENSCQEKVKVSQSGKGIECEGVSKLLACR